MGEARFGGGGMSGRLCRGAGEAQSLPLRKAGLLSLYEVTLDKLLNPSVFVSSSIKSGGNNSLKRLLRGLNSMIDTTDSDFPLQPCVSNVRRAQSWPSPALKS